MKRLLIITFASLMSLGMGSCVVEEHTDAAISWSVSYSGTYNSAVSAAWQTVLNTFDDTFSTLGPVMDHNVIIHDANVDKLTDQAVRLAEKADGSLDPAGLDALKQLETFDLRVKLQVPGNDETVVWHKDYAQGK